MSSSTASAPRAGMPRVNLLPPSEVARRERETLAGRWIWAGIGAVILSALLVSGAWVLNQLAQQSLLAEQNRTTTLIAELGGLSEVSGALATDRELRGYLAEAMGSDIVWEGVQATVESALPADVRLVGFDLTPGAPAPTKLSHEQATDSAGLTGTLTLDSPNTLDIAAVAAQLRTVGAVMRSDANAFAQSTVHDDRYTYTIDIAFDQRVYTERFAAGEKK